MYQHMPPPYQLSGALHAMLMHFKFAVVIPTMWDAHVCIHCDTWNNAACAWKILLQFPACNQQQAPAITSALLGGGIMRKPLVMSLGLDSTFCPGSTTAAGNVMLTAIRGHDMLGHL